MKQYRELGISAETDGKKSIRMGDRGPEPNSNKTEPEKPLLLNVAQLAQMLGISIRQVSRLDATGRLPQPIRLGRRKKWRSTEILNWINAGAPPRSRWRWDKGSGD